MSGWQDLRFRDGHLVSIDPASDSTRLHLRHQGRSPGLLAAAHWHPTLEETFTVVSGAAVFTLDGQERRVSAGEAVSIPARTVYTFSNLGADLELDHLVRPALNHLRMFQLWHQLDQAGRTNRHGIPRHPVDLARLWRLQDGYLAGPPAWLQRLALGGLAAWDERRR